MPCSLRCAPPSRYQQHKISQSSRTRQSIWAFSCALKRLHLGALVHISISQNEPVPTTMCSSPYIKLAKTCQSSRTRQSIWAFSCTLKRLRLSVSVYISTSQNGAVLTEMCSLLRTEPQLRGSRGEEREIVQVSAEAVRKSCG